jgi:hypothetical protein
MEIETRRLDHYRTTLSIKQETHQKLLELAASNSMTMSAVVDMAIRMIHKMAKREEKPSEQV